MVDRCGRNAVSMEHGKYEKQGRTVDCCSDARSSRGLLRLFLFGSGVQLRNRMSFPLSEWDVNYP